MTETTAPTNRCDPTFGLDDQVVIVTGAGRGIGRSIALAASRAGARVAVGSRTAAELDTLAAEIIAAGGACFTHALDVAEIASMQASLDAVVRRFGRVDALVNNAGHNIIATALDYEEEQFDHLVRVNYKSVFFFSQMAARQFDLQGGGGAIVNISSQAGCVGAPGRAVYSGAKAGVNNLTRTLAAEWAVKGIRVNVVAPTFTRTPLAESVLAANEDLRRAVTDKILLGRMAEPEEIAMPVIFLLSSAAAMITGHTLVVDGGWTIV